jgi:hypothetical protein
VLGAAKGLPSRARVDGDGSDAAWVAAQSGIPETKVNESAKARQAVIFQTSKMDSGGESDARQSRLAIGSELWTSR